MADQQYSDLPPGAQVVSVPETQNQPQSQSGQSQTFSDLPPGASVVSVPQSEQSSAPEGDYLSKAEDMISSAGDKATRYLQGFKQTTIDPLIDMGRQTRDYYNKRAEEAGGGVGGNLSAFAHTSNPLGVGIVDTLHQLAQHPRQAEQILKDAMKDPEHPLFKMAQGIVQSHMDTAGKTKDALAQMVAAVKRGDMDAAQQYESEAMGYGMATALPVVGPAAAHAGEAIGSGDIAGGLGQGSGLIAGIVGPHAVKAGIKSVLGDIPEGASTPETPQVPSEPGMLRPGVKTVGGQEIPVRAQGTVAKTAESLMTNSGKAKLQDFEVNQTQKAVRQGVANTVADAAGINPSDTAGKGDAFGFGGARDAIQARSKPVFQAIDKASDGAFSKAQNEANLARQSTDYAGKKAYQAAIEKQNQIFDSIKALAGKGETPELSANALDQAKADWKRSIGMDELKDRFDKYVQPTPASLAKPGVPDTGYVNPSQFRNGITDAIQSGEFDKAGFSPEHVQALEDMGVELEKAKVKFNDTLTNLAKHLVGGGIGSAIGGLTGGGIPGAVMGMGAEAGISSVLSRIMTSPKLVDAMTKGLKSGVPAASLSSRLWTMIKDDKGELTVPFTGSSEKPTMDYSYDNSGKSNVQHSVTSTDAAGKKVGELVAQDTGKNGNEVTVRSNQIYDEANRGKGYGKAQLERLIDETAKNPETKYLHSDSSTSGDARHVWESMERNYPDAVSKKTVGRGASARPIWTVDLDKIRNPEPSSPIGKGANEFNQANGRPAVQDEDVAPDRRKADIADAYEDMQHNPNDPAVKKSYAALVDDTKKQWDYATKKLGIKIEPTDADPYPNEQAMLDDVKNNKQLKVFRGGNPLPEDHPLAAIDPKTGESYNTMFRAVHDLFGHIPAENAFTEAGEEAAWNRHRQMMSPEATPAMTTETRGQTSWFYNNRNARAGAPIGDFAEQKAGLLPEFAHNRSAEFSQLADDHNANGGMTYNPSKGDMKGQSAYAVAGSYPELSKTLRTDKITPEQIKSYMDSPAVAKVLKENPNASIGTWAHDGKTELEITETPKSLSEATALGKKNNQVSIYDLKNGKEIQTGGTGTVASGRVGQRRPSAADSELGHDPTLNLGMDVVKQAGKEKPKYLQALADKVSEYPSMKFTPEGAEDSFNPDELAKLHPEKTVDDFVKQAADNIEWLHNQTPKHIREISKQWYDSAHEMTKKQADEYGISHPQAAAVTAVLSPQNPWDNNISLAKRVLDVWKNKQNFKWSPEMNKKAADLYNQSPAIAEFSDMIRGKKFSELHDENPDVESAMKALWTRVYDEAHNPRSFERWAPDGSTRGIARTDSGAPANSSWFSLLPISKALSVLEDGSMDNIHEQLGGSHKVRNFYNNIIDPNSKMGDTTIDTHAVGVAHMSPFSGDDVEVKNNFGGTKNAAHGLVGTYPLYAEAYKVAADRLGIQPRQLQSITWEGIRSLFKNKTPELRSAVRDIWKDHQDGEITIDEARKRIVKAAGGFKPTDWESDLGSNAEVGAPENTGELSRVGVPKEKPQADTGTGSGTSRGISNSGAETQGKAKGVFDLIGKKTAEPKFDWSKTRSVGNNEADAYVQAKAKLYPGKRELSLEEIYKVATEAAKLAKEVGPNKTTK